MRWRGGRRSTNVEDRRGARPSAGMRLPRGSIRIPGGIRLPGGSSRGGRGGLGGIGIVIVLIVLAVAFGIDPRQLLQTDPTGQAPGVGQYTPSAEEQQLADFVSVVLADTEDTWSALFPEQLGGEYVEPTLVLFSGAVQSACGFADAAVGPFYCPGDRQVYIDLDFYRDLEQRFGAPGDFAQAYVLAHEVGHHVQNLLGISSEVQAAQAQASAAAGNALSVRLELQADCFAGIWGHYAAQQQILEPGDLDEALGAASAIGDDRLQRQSRGYVAPDSFTHGSSEQRARWFRRGFDSGDLGACNTFDAPTL